MDPLDLVNGLHPRARLGQRGWKPLPKRKTTRITARDRLAHRIRVEHAAVGRNLRDSLVHARAAGTLLIQAKAKFRHGFFMAWVKEACQFSHATANIYMRIARQWERIAANSERVVNLSLGTVDRWLKESTKGTGRRHDWEQKFHALESRLYRAGQMLQMLLPAMNRLEAEQMRDAFEHLRRRVDEAIRQLDHHISGEMEEAARAVLVDLGVDPALDPPLEVVRSAS